MEPVKPTVARAFRLFFAFSWRLIAYTVFGTLVGGITLGVMFAFMQTSPEAKQLILAVATYVIGLPAMFLAAQHCLSKKIGDFRIMLVKAE